MIDALANRLQNSGISLHRDVLRDPDVCRANYLGRARRRAAHDNDVANDRKR